jgi:hypothetical protein
MKKINRSLFLTAAAILMASASILPAQVITGELRQWHQVILTFTGPATGEEADQNPFYDYRLDVTFEQEGRKLVVPGYFAANGDAANTSAK